MQAASVTAQRPAMDNSRYAKCIEAALTQLLQVPGLEDDAAVVEPLIAGAPRGVYLVGHSYGAAVAHRYRIDQSS